MLSSFLLLPTRRARSVVVRSKRHSALFPLAADRGHGALRSIDRKHTGRFGFTAKSIDLILQQRDCMTAGSVV